MCSTARYGVSEHEYVGHFEHFEHFEYGDNRNTWNTGNIGKLSGKNETADRLGR